MQLSTIHDAKLALDNGMIKVSASDITCNEGVSGAVVNLKAESIFLDEHFLFPNKPVATGPIEAVFNITAEVNVFYDWEIIGVADNGSFTTTSNSFMLIDAYSADTQVYIGSTNDLGVVFTDKFDDTIKTLNLEETDIIRVKGPDDNVTTYSVTEGADIIRTESYYIVEGIELENVN